MEKSCGVDRACSRSGRSVACDFSTNLSQSWYLGIGLRQVMRVCSPGRGSSSARARPRAAPTAVPHKQKVRRSRECWRSCWRCRRVMRRAAARAAGSTRSNQQWRGRVVCGGQLQPRRHQGCGGRSRGGVDRKERALLIFSGGRTHGISGLPAVHEVGRKVEGEP